MASRCYIGLPRGLGGDDFPSLFSAGIIDVLMGALAATMELEVPFKMVEQKDKESVAQIILWSQYSSLPMYTIKNCDNLKLCPTYKLTC